jgi:hypothetical protein
MERPTPGFEKPTPESMIPGPRSTVMSSDMSKSLKCENTLASTILRIYTRAVAITE